MLVPILVLPREFSPTTGAAVLEDPCPSGRPLGDHPAQAGVHALGLGPPQRRQVVVGEVAPTHHRVLLLEVREGVGRLVVEDAGLELAEPALTVEELLAAEAPLGVIDDVDLVLQRPPVLIGLGDPRIVLRRLRIVGVEAGLLQLRSQVLAEPGGLALVLLALGRRAIGDHAGEAGEDLGIKAGLVETSLDRLGQLPLAVDHLQRRRDPVELEVVALVLLEGLAVGIVEVVGEANVHLAVLVGRLVFGADGLVAKDVRHPAVAEVDDRVPRGLGLGDLHLFRRGGVVIKGPHDARGMLREARLRDAGPDRRCGLRGDDLGRLGRPRRRLGGSLLIAGLRDRSGIGAGRDRREPQPADDPQRHRIPSTETF